MTTLTRTLTRLALVLAGCGDSTKQATDAGRTPYADAQGPEADARSSEPDPGDASFADLSVDLGNAAIGRDLTELRAVEGALARIKNGTYGECGECGYEIPYERLLAQPTAERCTACQGTFERTHAEHGRGATM